MTPEAFKKWRLDRGWTQAGAAAKLGLARRTISAIEAGQIGGKIYPISRAIELATEALARRQNDAAHADDQA